MTSGADANRHPDGPHVPRADRAPAAPARPTVGGEGFAAVMDVGARPASLVVSVVSWLAGAAAGLTAAALLWVERAAVQERLAAVATQQDPGVAADVVADSARYAFLAGAGAVAVVAVVHVVLAVLLSTGRAWARPALVLAGVVGVVVAVAVQDLAADPARTVLAHPARITLLVQAGLVVAALAFMHPPAVGRWLRRARALQR